MKINLLIVMMFMVLSGKTVAITTERVSPNNQDGLILKVEKGSVWEAAGFEDGDIIKSVNGVNAEKSKNAQALVNVLRSGGKSFAFKVLRAGKIVDVEVVVE